jgi:hypothetical protein
MAWLRHPLTLALHRQAMLTTRCLILSDWLIVVLKSYLLLSFPILPRYPSSRVADAH